MSLQNKVVIVTGGGSGIGQATVILLAKEQAKVAIVDKNEERAKETAKQCIEFGGIVIAVAADVSKDDQVKKVIKETVDNFGQIDILVNNAGIVREGSLLSGKVMDTFDELIDVNLRAAVLMTNTALPFLIKTKGCIVNMSSVASHYVNVTYRYPIYSVTKAGVDAFTKAAAKELSQVGIRVNAVNPGPVLTNIYNDAGISASLEDSANTTLFGRLIECEEIGNLIVYLASDKAKNITGACYAIDGGSTLL